MANLLEQASILLTATASDNGKVLCVKPSAAPYGDLDFSRNSSATRVNAQGLVEDVQILSGNLVTNGDFSQEGAELVTSWVNNDFTAFSSNGSDITQMVSSASGNNCYSSSAFISGKSYKLEFTSSQSITAQVRVSPNTSLTSGLVVLSNPVIGVNSIIFTPSSNFSYIGFYAASVFSDTQITNFSVREVGQDWTFTNGWNIGTNKAIFDDTTTNRISQIGLSIISGKKYKIGFTIADCPTTAHMTIYDSGGSDLILPNENYVNGDYVRYYTATTNETGLSFWGNTNLDTFSITNISFIEVTDDTNLPRINYDGFSYDGSGAIIPNSGCGSWLWEGQSTNLITQSELFSNAYWTKSGSSVVSGFVSPSGDTNAFKLVEDNGSSAHILFKNNINTGSGKSTISIKAKADSRNWIFIYDTEQVEGCFFDLSNGTVGTVIGSPDAYSITALSNGWYDINLTTTSTTRVDFQVYLAIADNNFNYQGDGASGLYIWGAQLEFLSYATSYIPTEGTTKTRNRDLCTGGGSAALINSTEGVLYFEGSTLANDGTNRYLSINDGTVSNYIYFRYVSTSNQVLMRTQVGGVTINTISTFLTDTTLNAKFALKWKSGDYAFWVNGVEVGTDSSTTIFTANTLNLIEYSFPTDGGGGFPSKTKCLAVFPYLSDTELAELTTI